MPTVTLHIGDVRDVMATLPDNCADVLITSPPFLALRSYLPADHPDKHRELGSEPTPAAFLDSLYGLTEDWGRLVPEWGSICVELGDTMSGSGGAGGDYTPDGLREGQPRFRQDRVGRYRAGYVAVEANGNRHAPLTKDSPVVYQTAGGGPGWPLAKSMCLIPHLYTIGLAYGHNPLTGQAHQAGQWRIRNVITWARPNPPVGSLGKRNVERRTGDQKFRPACSYITVACRGTGRYFDLDAVRTDVLHPNGFATRPNDHPGHKGMCPQRVCTVCGPRHRLHGRRQRPHVDTRTRTTQPTGTGRRATQPFRGNSVTVTPAPHDCPHCACDEWGLIAVGMDKSTNKPNTTRS
jgi:hypothetical protein